MDKKQATANILGVQVDLLGRKTLEEIIDTACKRKNKPIFLVTAYSEFFLEAKNNAEFNQALQRADYILPDGVSVLEAADYLSSSKSSVIIELLRGLSTGIKTIIGKYNTRIRGVWLVSSLLTEKKHTIFLLGGRNGVAKKLGEKYGYEYFEGPIDIDLASEEENNTLIKKVNAARPEILLVSFGRFKQEIWIAKHLDKLTCQVVIGVGSSFDEILGEGKWAKKVPEWVETMGLKWLWRLTIEPSHIKRIPHIPQFAWAVFLQKLKNQ